MSNKKRNKELYEKGFLSEDSLKKLDRELFEKLEREKIRRDEEVDNLLQDAELVARLLSQGF